MRPLGGLSDMIPAGKGGLKIAGVLASCGATGQALPRTPHPLKSNSAAIFLPYYRQKGGKFQGASRLFFVCFQRNE